MAGSERSSRGPRKVPLPMSASLGSCSVAQPGSSCRGFAQALPRAPLRGTRRPRRKPASPDCCRGNVAPSSTATSTGCPPSRMYELAEDPRTAAGHAVAGCEPAGAEDAVGKRHSDRRHHPSSRPDGAGLTTTVTITSTSAHRRSASSRARTCPGAPRQELSSGGTMSCSPGSGSDNEITLWPGESQTLTATYSSRPISPPLSSAFRDGTGRRSAPAPAP
jgi:hypothetical protein